MIDSNIAICTPGKGDIQDICRIWHSCFGDPEELIEELLSIPGFLESMTAAYADGVLRSFVCCFDRLHLGGVNCAYIYALATEREFRGKSLASKVMKTALENAFAKGAELVCLRPSDPGLEQWYARSFSMERVCRYSQTELKPRFGGGISLRALSAEEYLTARRSCDRLSQELIKAQELLCSYYGGGFLEIVMGGLSFWACCELKQDGVFIREWNCPDEHQSDTAGAICTHFGIKRAFLQCPSDMSGTASLFALSRSGLNYDNLFLSLTLD